LRVLPDDEALDLLEHGRRRQWISLPELARRVRDHAGRRGAPRLAGLMRIAAGGTRSAAERRAVALLKAAGIRGWQVNAEIHDDVGLVGRGDLVFRAARLVVELDGWAFHSDPDRFQHDRTRQNRLVRAGWTVLRFTWRDLADRPDAVVAEVSATLARLRGRAAA
jgi:very-short-patch-repair endonuclease